MDNVYVFMPQAAHNARQRVEAYIEHCRTKLTAFGKELPFDLNHWDITNYVSLIGKRKSLHVNYFKKSPVGVHWSKERRPMDDPLRSFAKAYVRDNQQRRPTEGVSKRIDIFRLLELAYLEQGVAANIWELNSTLLNRAIQMAAERYDESSLSFYSGEYETLLLFLNQKGMLVTPFTWRVPVRRRGKGTRKAIQVGEEADRRREDNLPSPEAITGLGIIFQNEQDSDGVIITAATGALLFCANARIGEVVTLPKDSEFHNQGPDDATAYGLRWRPLKGADDMVKWIMPDMVPTAMAAISKIRVLTEEARTVAKWYEKHPDKMYLPKHLEHYRDKERLTLAELGEMLWKERKTKGAPPKDTWAATSPETYKRYLLQEAARRWCAGSRTNKETGRRLRRPVPILKNGRDKNTVAFSDVEKVFLEDLMPPGFPIAEPSRKLTYVNSLFLGLRGQMSDKDPTYWSAIEFIHSDLIRRRLIESSTKTIFKRYGIVERDGKMVSLRPHQPRHYLNTMGQANNLSQLDNALWSGRKRVEQNVAYDNVAPAQLAERVASLVRLKDGEELPLPVILQTPHFLVLRSEFADKVREAAHTTDYGHCVHDFAALPCPRFRDCPNCNESCSIKGEQGCEDSLRLRLLEARLLLEKAEAAHVSGEYGANRWVEAQRKTVERLERRLAVHDDPQLPDGAVIVPIDIPPTSRIKEAQRRRVTWLAVATGTAAEAIPQQEADL